MRRSTTGEYPSRKSTGTGHETLEPPSKARVPRRTAVYWRLRALVPGAARACERKWRGRQAYVIDEYRGGSVGVREVSLQNFDGESQRIAAEFRILEHNDGIFDLGRILG